MTYPASRSFVPIAGAALIAVILAPFAREDAPFWGKAGVHLSGWTGPADVLSRVGRSDRRSARGLAAPPSLWRRLEGWLDGAPGPKPLPLLPRRAVDTRPGHWAAVHLVI